MILKSKASHFVLTEKKCENMGAPHCKKQCKIVHEGVKPYQLNLYIYSTKINESQSAS
jgi:hypothetical protein